MKRFLLGLLALILTFPRVGLMLIAYVVVSLAEWMERLQELVDERRGIVITQVGETDDRARTVADIINDFTPELVNAYVEHVGEPLHYVVDRHGSDWVYWDIKDWSTK